jgi:2,3-bisphosphoglycerate-dependent phosphoglycerate mutase
MTEANIKKIYFVRHGETLANRNHIHQGPDEPLSDKGRTQAEAVGEVLKNFNIDTLISSSFVRARQTAEIISQNIDVPLTLMDEVVEFRRPNSIYGKSHYSLDSLLYIADLFQHQRDPLWENDGAENLFHIHQRMLSAQKILESLPGKNIVVVSHAIFMDMFTQVVCAERDLKLSEFVKGLIGIKKVPNTGIVEFHVDELAPGGTCKWWFQGFQGVAKMPT